MLHHEWGTGWDAWPKTGTQDRLSSQLSGLVLALGFPAALE